MPASVPIRFILVLKAELECMNFRLYLLFYFPYFSFLGYSKRIYLHNEHIMILILCRIENGTRRKNRGHRGPPAAWPVRPGERSRC